MPGLRRSELAALAGVSVEYYTRIERGNLSGVSDNVIEAIAGALQLDNAERAHLFDLARASQPAATTRRRRATRQQVRPSVQWVLDCITGAAAFVSNGSHDILAANQLGEALWSPLYANVDRPVNSARYLFLDATALEMYPDWERIANETVAIMRRTAGADPRDRRLSELIGELSIRSEEFRTRWASHNVRFHNTGTKRFIHPLVGELTLNFERFDLAAENGLTMFTYAAEPGTRSAEGLDLLASWTATPHAPQTNRSHLKQIDNSDHPNALAAFADRRLGFGRAHRRRLDRARSLAPRDQQSGHRALSEAFGSRYRLRTTGATPHATLGVAAPSPREWCATGAT